MLDKYLLNNDFLPEKSDLMCLHNWGDKPKERLEVEEMEGQKPQKAGADGIKSMLVAELTLKGQK